MWGVIGTVMMAGSLAWGGAIDPANTAKFEKDKYIAGQKGIMFVSSGDGWTVKKPYKKGDNEIVIGKSAKVKDFKRTVLFEKSEREDWDIAATTGYWAIFGAHTFKIKKPDSKLYVLVFSGEHGPQKTRAKISGAFIAKGERKASPWRLFRITQSLKSWQRKAVKEG